MSSVTGGFSSSAASAFAAFAARFAATLRRLAVAWGNHRGLVMLARLDDHALRDIGLSRSDVRDALEQPWWNDPTDTLLERRRAERRESRPRALPKSRQGPIPRHFSASRCKV